MTTIEKDVVEIQQQVTTIEYVTPPAQRRQNLEDETYRAFTHAIFAEAQKGYEHILEVAPRLLRSNFSVLRCSVVYGDSVYSSDSIKPDAATYLNLKREMDEKKDRFRSDTQKGVQRLAIPLLSSNGNQDHVDENESISHTLTGIVVLEWFGSGNTQPMSDRHIDSSISLFQIILDSARNGTLARAISDQRILDGLRTQETVYPKVERHDMAILFADLTGSTELAEQLSADEFVETVNAYHEVAGEILRTYKLYIDKFQGDAIMAVANAFGDQESDYIVRSAFAALEIQEAVKTLNEVRRNLGLPTMEYKIGVHAGSAIFGPVGFQHRYDMTPMGDTVNIAKRVEETSTGSEITITQQIVDELAKHQQFTCVSKGNRQLKGKSQFYELFVLKRCA